MTFAKWVGIFALFGALTVGEAIAAPLTAKDFAMKRTAGHVELGPEAKSLSLLSRTYSKFCENDRLERKPPESCDADERFLAPTDVVIVFDMETMAQKKVVAIPANYTVQWMEWTSTDNLLISLRSGWSAARSTRRSGSNINRRQYIPPSGRILSIKISGDAKPVILFGDERRLLRNNRNLDRTANLLRGDPDHVIMGAYRSDDFDLFRVNVNDGSAERVAKGKRLTWAWYTDKDGVPAVRIDCQSSRCRTMRAYRPEDGADPNDEDTDWVYFRSIDRKKRGDQEISELEIVAPAEAPGEYYVEVEGEGHERRSVKLYNIRTDTFVRDVYSDPTHDVAFAIIDRETGRFAGAAVWKDRIEYTMVDSTLQKHLNAINSYFDDSWNISMIGFSNDGGKAIVSASAPNDPGAYYLYDFKTYSVSQLINSYGHMPAMLDSQTEILSVPTRDGQTITGYHTVPGDSVSRGDISPLIVLVHGGPEARDVYNYNRDVQFLASRGFQVLQINFRGSSGYGRSFAEAGYRQWGGVMHDDVMDATRHMVEKGVATPETTCVMGHSYGGYAALLAGAKAPDEFACVISGAGVSDLVESLKQDRKEHGADSASFAYWEKSIGDMRLDRDALLAISPARMARRFDDPVLLIHGSEDRVVQVSHSEEMFEALEKAGKTVTYLELDEGHYHNRWSIESSTQYFEQLEGFLNSVFPRASAAQGRSGAP